MDEFVLTLAEAREMYRRYGSPRWKLKKRLPGGECWQYLGTSLGALGQNPNGECLRLAFQALSLFFLGRRVTDRLLPFRPVRKRFPSEGPLTLYHWFPVECRTKIQLEGLQPGAADGLVFMTDDPDFPRLSPYFCRKVVKAGRDLTFCPVKIDGNRLSRCQEIYPTYCSHEFAVRQVPPECLDFCE